MHRFHDNYFISQVITQKIIIILGTKKKRVQHTEYYWSFINIYKFFIFTI